MKQSNFIKIYIFPLMFISPILTMSCNSWFSMWMMMELNMMSFIPMIIYLNKYFKELAFKYLIIQSISSSILILSTTTMLMNINKNYPWLNLMINLTLLMKLGFPPFHNWFINMMNNMNWLNCMILSTWQKIIPMIMLMNIFNKFILIFNLYAIILSSMLNLNHQSLRIIFSYSSINHMSWMIFNLMMSEMMWMLYFIMYMIINMSLMLIMKINNIYYINQMFTMNINKKWKMIMFMNLISICGLPPLFGFNMKWLSIYFLSYNNFFLMNIMMIIMSTLTFIFYTRIMIAFMMISMMKNKLLSMNKFNNKLIPMILMLSFLNLWIMSIWMF